MENELTFMDVYIRDPEKAYQMAYREWLTYPRHEPDGTYHAGESMVLNIFAKWMRMAANDLRELGYTGEDLRELRDAVRAEL